MQQAWLSGIRNFVDRQSRRIEIMRQLSEYLESDPDFAGELERMFSAAPSGNGNGAAVHSPTANLGGNGVKAETYEQRVVKYLQATRDQWQTAMEIANGVGLPGPSTRHILYKIIPDQLERKQSPDNARGVLWRIRE